MLTSFILEDAAEHVLLLLHPEEGLASFDQSVAKRLQYTSISILKTSNM